QMASLRALILLVDGVEEIEVIGTTDFLRRAGIEVTMAGLFGLDPITCSEKARLLPDAALDDVVKETYNVIVVPGGKVQAFSSSPKVGEILRAQLSSGRHVAAICAAPAVLASHGIQKGGTVTSHPLARHKMEEAGYNYSEDNVVVDGKLITSRGPGTTFEFALKVVEILLNSEEAKRLREFMVVL
ncbi:hypothetical protein PENTCL1PPCAC_15696, partial [Pristionchus entomophagus]